MKILKRILLIEILIFIFYLGGILGIKIGIDTREDELTKMYIELEDEQEKNYQLELENKKLNTILNSYTIQERQEEQ